jgi:PPOX class probable F420-dependent enzyme
MNDKRETGLSALRRGKYLSLASFRKSGEAVYTPLWFAEQDGKLYIMTRDDSWKYKRIFNNPNVRIAPCTMRGRIIGPELPARASVLSGEESGVAQRPLKRKYLLLRFPWFRSKHNVFLEITAA